jgi:hypothetical protein
MSTRKLRVVPSAPPSAQPAPGAYVEHPLDTAVVILAGAHATLDLLYTLAGEIGPAVDAALQLCDGSLVAALDGVMRRIQEVREIVEGLSRAAKEGT